MKKQYVSAQMEYLYLTKEDILTLSPVTEVSDTDLENLDFGSMFSKNN